MFGALGCGLCQSGSERTSFAESTVGATRSAHELECLGAASTAQEQPGAPRSSQEQPGAPRRSQECPGATMNHQEQPGAARSSGEQPRECLFRRPSYEYAWFCKAYIFPRAQACAHCENVYIHCPNSVSALLPAMVSLLLSAMSVGVIAVMALASSVTASLPVSVTKSTTACVVRWWRRRSMRW